MRVSLLFLLFATADLLVATVAQGDDRRSLPQSSRLTKPRAVMPSGSAGVAYSDNFVVRSQQPGQSASKLLETCEQLRGELQTTWAGKVPPAPWRPRCEVVLHANSASYAQAVGRGAAQTSGSSLIQFRGAQVALRRIDLAPVTAGKTSALAHELTHVVVADCFQGRQPPKWLDEGIATRADSAEKQRLHERDFHQALNAGSTFALADLLTIDRCATYDQYATFYGQSLSLVDFLVRQGTPDRVVLFANAALREGYDRALQQVYGIDNLAQLDQLWRTQALAASTSATAATPASLSQTAPE